MNRREQLLKVVVQDVQHDCEDYRALRDLMQQLHKQLQMRNSQQINVLNEQILVHIEQGHARAQRRSKILAALKLDSADKGMQALLLQLGDRLRVPLQKRWQELGELASECKRLNDRNGKLLAMHNEILDQLMRADAGAELYGPQCY